MSQLRKPILSDLEKIILASRVVHAYAGAKKETDRNKEAQASPVKNNKK